MNSFFGLVPFTRERTDSVPSTSKAKAALESAAWPIDPASGRNAEATGY
jgi:hypothetical protein